MTDGVFLCIDTGVILIDVNTTYHCLKGCQFPKLFVGNWGIKISLIFRACQPAEVTYAVNYAITYLFKFGRKWRKRYIITVAYEKDNCGVRLHETYVFQYICNTVRPHVAERNNFSKTMIVIIRDAYHLLT